jgi:hypothetical protein
VLLGSVVAPAGAQVRDPVEGWYDLTVFGHDSVARPLVLGQIVLVMTAAPIAREIAAGLHSVIMDDRPPAPDHGACWRTAAAASTPPPAHWSAHTAWHEVGGIVTVTLWRSADAGDELRFVVRGNRVRGEVFRWRHDGAEVFDSVIGTRRGAADVRRCAG